jgi:mRNA interferase MazF
MKIIHGHLYLADLNPRRGTEPGKTRPVVVLQTDLLNDIKHPSTWVIPCTTKLVGENLLRVVFTKGIAGNAKACEAMIDQSRAIDNARFVRYLAGVPLPLLREIKTKLRAFGDF